MMGLVGAITVLPRSQRQSVKADVDVMLTMQQWWWEAEGALVNPFGNDGHFGWFTINGRTGEASGGPIDIAAGDLVRLRLYNAGQGVHAMHLHGHDQFRVAKNGHAVPVVRQTTQSISPGDFFLVEFVARPGNWLFHCHFPHHTANRMLSGWRGSPVGMSRIFHTAGAPPVPPEYFSDNYYLPPPGVPPR
ncbi:multicopper oxidase domain-containing protein [Prauserella shujinwangii]|nr:multicopper oxidase domain-containing protein [Prauserella shujinwangii]